ncbi:MAG: hypothetical protein ACRC2R_02365 [Xenococcaceae cyanobacterium]
MKIKGTENPDYLQGTSDNDKIFALGGDDTIVGSGGGDAIDGGAGNDTLDLQNLGVSVTATFGSKYVYDNPNSPMPSKTFNRAELKSSLGKINAIDVETVIAPNDQVNTIDASRIGGVVIDLEAGYSRGSYRFERTTNFQNFDNAIGTGLNDTLIGNYKNNSLTGSSRNDNLDGKDGDDTLLGTDFKERGSGLAGSNPTYLAELDTLTGGGGSDRFILGDRKGAYYKTNGNSDFATITDFGSGDLIQLGKKDTYSVVRNDSGFDLFVTTGGANDLIASVQNASTMGIASFGDTLSSIPEGNFAISSGENIGGIFIGA